MTEGLGFGRRRVIEKIVEQNWDVKEARLKKFSFNELLFVIQELNTEEGKKYNEKRVGLRGHYIFKEFVKLLLYRNLANYDSMILITAEKGCLTDDTLIEMPRDLKKYPKGIPIKDLIDKGPIMVYSFNPKTKKIELKKSDGVEFAKKSKVCKIETDKGKEIIGTYDHPILTKKGTYKQMSEFNPYYREKIITKDGVEEVIGIDFSLDTRNTYDVVNVRDNHNFIANGFVVSNTGKSSASIMLARQWCKLLGIKFNPARHIAYNNADVMHKIDILKKFEPIICDEAIRFACLAGQTKIKTDHGFIKIKDLEGRENFNVYSYNETTKKEEIKKAEKCIKVREDELYEIELENGQKIQATKEHKFLTSNGWKMLKNLTDEDEIIGN